MFLSLFLFDLLLLLLYFLSPDLLCVFLPLFPGLLELYLLA